MKLSHDTMNLNDAEPLSRDQVIQALNRLGIRVVFEDTPRMAQSEEMYEAMDRYGRRLMATARKMRDESDWSPE